MAIALLARPAAAQAPARRIALIDPGAALESAVRAALEPWSVAITIVFGPSPGATAPDTNQAAHALALAQGVSAVVWVSEHDGRNALWVYDLETDHVIERELGSAPPFDGPAAAAVALSIKTLLRHSATAPPNERYGAAPTPNAAVTPAAPPQQPEPVTAPPSDTPAPQASAQRNTPSTLDLALGAGLRFEFTRPRAVEPRFALALAWWPARGAIGLGVAAAFGPGVTVDEAQLHARLVDAAASVALLLRHDITRIWRVSAGLGASTHILVLDGTLPAEQRSISDVRLSPALDLRPQLEWRLSARVRLGLWAELSYLIRAERYWVQDQTLLEVAHFGLSAGLALRVDALE